MHETRFRLGRSVGLVTLLYLCGCQSMSRDEIAWQTLHVMDVAQTLNAASDPCYVESSWLTQQLIGDQPRHEEVLVWGIGTAIIHMLVSRTLEARDAPQWLQRAWSVTTISHTAYAVATNHSEGVRMWGDNDPRDCRL